MKCYCGDQELETKTSKDGRDYFSCPNREWDKDTQKSSGGCDFFFFESDVDEDKVCDCGDLWIPVRQKKYAFCRNHVCPSHKLERINESLPIWQEFELGEAFDPKPHKPVFKPKPKSKNVPKTTPKKNFKK